MMLLLVSAGAAQSEVERLNAALATPDYVLAEAALRDMLQRGDTAGDVWYDLGNVLYRQGRLAEAAHAWRTADVRLPRDPDVDANLELVRRSFRDGLVATDTAPWFAPWQAALTIEEGFWLGAAFAGAGLGAIALRRRRPEWPMVGAGTSAAVLGGLFLLGASGEGSASSVGVVRVPEIVVTSDLSGGVELFTLHAGAEVTIFESAAERTLVGLPDGRKGWMSSGSLLVVDPDGPLVGLEVL